MDSPESKILHYFVPVVVEILCLETVYRLYNPNGQLKSMFE